MAFRLGIIAFRKPCTHRRRTAPGTRSPLAGRRRCAGRRNDWGLGVPRRCQQNRRARCENDVLEPDAALRPELSVLRLVPVEVLHRHQRSTTCAIRHTLALAILCPPVCPNSVRGPSSASQRQPSYQWKTGLKSWISGPFLIRAALANRRLRPLGHLTATRSLSIYDIAVYETGCCPHDCHRAAHAPCGCATSPSGSMPY